MKSFHLTVLEADEPFFEGECVSVVIPASDGMYGIMAGHTNFICAVIPGELRYKTADGTEYAAAVSSGIFKVENGDVMLLTESAERAEEIDENRARLEAQQAKDEMQHHSSIKSYNAAQAKMVRALNRIRVKGAYQNAHKSR